MGISKKVMEALRAGILLNERLATLIDKVNRIDADMRRMNDRLVRLQRLVGWPAPTSPLSTDSNSCPRVLPSRTSLGADVAADGASNGQRMVCLALRLAPGRSPSNHQ